MAFSPSFMWRLTQATYICFSVVLLAQHTDTVSQNVPFYQLQADESWSFDDVSTYPFQTVTLTVAEKALPFHTKKPHTAGFVFWLLLFVLVIWAWLKTDQPRRVSQLADSFFSNRFVDQWIREEGLLRSEVNIWLLLTSFVVLALSLQQIPWLMGIFQLTEEPRFIQFLWLFFGSIVLFFARLLLIQLGNFLTTSFSFAPVYVFNEFIFIQASALSVFPLVLLQAYADIWSDWIYAVLIMATAVILFASRIIKLGYLGVSQTSFSPFYIILYLCSLEILPLVIVYAWLFK